MAKAPRKTINEIRNFTNRNGGNVNTWLPSTGTEEEFDNTFSLFTNNVIPPGFKDTGSKVGGEGAGQGEINVLTEFNVKKLKDTAFELENNTLKYYLALYCLNVLEQKSGSQEQVSGFSGATNSLSYNKNDKLFSEELSLFLQQMHLGGARGLASDQLRFFRGRKLTDTIKNDKNISDRLDYISKSTEYKRYVTGALGRITYDSIVRNTLFYLLKKEGILKDLKIKQGDSWSNECSKLKDGEFDYFIDSSGGTYTRAFPIVSVFTRAKSGKSLEDLINSANEFTSSKFFRNVTKDQLVKPILAPNTKKPVGGEKNFIEIPNSASGDSFYCFVYDFTKIIILDQNIENNYTLDILKICLSFLSRKRKFFVNKQEFIEYYQSVSKFVRSRFTNLDNLNFTIRFKNKHAEESAYILEKQKESFSNNFNQIFSAQLEQVLKSLEQNYEKIINIFDSQITGEKRNFQFDKYDQDSIQDTIVYLHYDNFYNLLAITTQPYIAKQEQKSNWDEYPFDLNQYVFKPKFGNIVSEFFAQGKPELPVIPENSQNPDYKFIENIALSNDIVFITDIFLKQAFEILEEGKDKFIYENDSNANNQDKVLKANSINILSLIKQRTSNVDKKVNDLKRGDVIFFSSGNYYLKTEIVKVVRLKDFAFSFSSVKEDLIKMQTLNHLMFFLNEDLKKKNLTNDDFRELVYYPILNPVTPVPKKPVEVTKQKDPTKNDDFLINNIISSELACYEDIANSFDKAINAENFNDKLYFVFQTLVNIGLPILLAAAAKKIADKLQSLLPPGQTLTAEQISCIEEDRDKLKKNILGYADLITNLKSPEELFGYLTQGYFQLPAIPAIPFITTFDAEKELKRRLLKYVIDDLILPLLSEQLKKALQSFSDMCNSDSYLSAFLATAIPKADLSGRKLGAPTPSGLIASSSPTTYIPQIIANINILIDQSGIQPRNNVYQSFRVEYDVDYDNQKISDFFTYLSNAVDAGQLATLLKGTSSLDTRLTILSYIKNYEDKDFYTLIYDTGPITELFDFLSLYIDYQLCYGIVSNSLQNYSADICLDINSKFDESALQFGETAIEDEIADLTNELIEFCSLKRQLSYDPLTGGPLLITNGVKRSLGIGVEQNVNTINTFSEKVLNGISEQDTIEDPIKSKVGNKALSPQDVSYPNALSETYVENTGVVYSEVISEYIKNDDQPLSELLKFSTFINKIAYDRSANFRQIFLTTLISDKDKISFFKKVYQSGPKNKNFKKTFNEKLNNSGNSSLKTNITTFSGYIDKLNELKNKKVIIEDFNFPKGNE